MEVDKTIDDNISQLNNPGNINNELEQHGLQKDEEKQSEINDQAENEDVQENDKTKKNKKQNENILAGRKIFINSLNKTLKICYELQSKLSSDKCNDFSSIYQKEYDRIVNNFEKEINKKKDLIQFYQLYLSIKEINSNVNIDNYSHTITDMVSKINFLKLAFEEKKDKDKDKDNTVQIENISLPFEHNDQIVNILATSENNYNISLQIIEKPIDTDEIKDIIKETENNLNTTPKKKNKTKLRNKKDKSNFKNP